MWCVQARMGGYKNTLNISGQSSGAKHLLLFGSGQSKEAKQEISFSTKLHALLRKAVQS